jgi:hypothetical protein
MVGARPRTRHQAGSEPLAAPVFIYSTTAPCTHSMNSVVNYWRGTIRHAVQSNEENQRGERVGHLPTDDVMDMRYTSDGQMVIITKYWGPLVCFVGTGALLVSNHPTASTLAWRLVINSPILLAGMFLMCVVELRANNGGFEYRHFLKWKPISYRGVLECRKSWFPGVGLMVLDRFVSPLGRIYFVNSRPLSASSTTDLVAYINGRVSGNAAPLPHGEKVAPPENKRGVRFPLIMVFVGFFGSILSGGFFPGPLSKGDSAGLPPIMAWLMRISVQLGRWPWGLVICVALIVQAFRLRFTGRGWIPAFLLGVVLGSMAIQALR